MGEVLRVTQSPESRERRDELASRLSDFSAMVDGLDVTDEDDYEAAADLLAEAKSFANDLEEAVDKPREEAHNIYKHFLSEKKEVMGPANDVIETIKSAMEDFRERRHRELEEERQKLMTKASSDDPDEVAEALERVQEMDDEPTPDVDGVHYRTTWTGELEDGDVALRRLCKAIAEGEAPASLVSLNSKKANELARQRKRELDKIPGLKSVRDETLVDRR